MNVNDKRPKHEPIVWFVDLPIGQAYEDGDGVLCIKTNRNNCIYFFEGKWEAEVEDLTSKVIPLITTLEIER